MKQVADERQEYWNGGNKIIIIFNYMIVTVENPREVVENLLEPVKENNTGPVQNKLFFKNLSKSSKQIVK